MKILDDKQTTQNTIRLMLEVELNQAFLIVNLGLIPRCLQRF